MLKPVRLVVAAVAVALSGFAMGAQQPAPNYLPASAAATFENAPAIVEGAAGKNVKSTIYVFMDPNCIFCHYAWKAFQPYEAAGLQVHWIPMGFLKPDSAGKAAALLQAQDGPALMHELETQYKDVSGSRLRWHADDHLHDERWPVGRCQWLAAFELIAGHVESAGATDYGSVFATVPLSTVRTAITRNPQAGR
jgi:hypothetical protein